MSVAAQCLGRLVKDTPKGLNMLEFDQGGLFHIPIRCTTIAQNGDLCESCQAREKKTQEKVRGITGKNTTIKGTLPSYLMGRVIDPIPFWSRLYGGAWYRLKIKEGCTVSEATMAKAKKAAAIAYEGVMTVEPRPMPDQNQNQNQNQNQKGKAKTKTKTKVAAATAVTEIVPVVAVVAVVPVTAPAKEKTKKRRPNKVVETPEPIGPPVAIIPNPTQELPVENVKEINVRKREIDGRSLYLGAKDKVYDLKFKYLGRLKEEKIVSFPDSDEGM